MMRYPLYLFAFFACFYPAVAIGIGPAFHEMDFEGNEGREVAFSNVVINNAGRDMPVSIYMDPNSDLAPYVILPEEKDFVIPKDGRTTISYRIRFPQDLGKPGYHNLKIGVVEGSASSGGLIGTVTAATTLIRVFVSYPGKYLEVQPMIENVEQGVPAILTLTLKSRGKEVINSLTGNVGIYSQDILVEELGLGSYGPINPLESLVMKAEWDTKDQKISQYKAVFTYVYDGKQEQVEKFFNVGKETIEFLDFTNQFEQDKINKFMVGIRSNWNYPLEDVYARINILRGGVQVAQLMTPTTTVSPWGEYALEAFWDTTGMPLGTYDVMITVHFSDSEMSTTGRVNMMPPSEAPSLGAEARTEGGMFSSTTLIIVLVSLLVVAIFTNIIILMRKRK